MFSTIENGIGLYRCFWSDVRQRINEVEPEFAKLVDDLSPDFSFPLYLAYYPYGAIDADTKSSLFPSMKETYFRISDLNTEDVLYKELGYSLNHTPFGMVLDKEIECFIDLNKEQTTIPSNF